MKYLDLQCGPTNELTLLPDAPLPAALHHGGLDVGPGARYPVRSTRRCPYLPRTYRAYACCGMSNTRPSCSERTSFAYSACAQTSGIAAPLGRPLNSSRSGM